MKDPDIAAPEVMFSVDDLVQLRGALGNVAARAYNDGRLWDQAIVKMALAALERPAFIVPPKEKRGKSKRQRIGGQWGGEEPPTVPPKEGEGG